ncbi:hypothetical protein HKD37_05G013444 [Glycine soja]
MQKIDALIHHLPQPAPPSHFPSSFAITASHGCLSLYSDHARPQHPPVHLFPPPSSSTTTPSSSSAKALLAHIPMPTPPLMSTPPPTPPPPFMPTQPPTPPPPPLPALRQQHPTPVPTPPTIVVIPLLVNNKPHAPSDRRWATLFQICKEYPSRRILSSDLCSFSLVTIVAKVGGTELEIANQGYRRKQSPKERKNGEIVQQRKTPGTMRQILSNYTQCSGGGNGYSELVAVEALAEGVWWQ